jgi:peptide deformylase
MAILKVARLGNPILRKKSDMVDPAEMTRPEFQRFIDDMIETMREYDGVGLAAPQVHISKQIAVIEAKGNPRYPESPDIPLTVIINPTVISMSKEKREGWEGCLSVDNLRGRVPRSTRMVVKALDRQGKEFTLDASGFLAIVLQHEIDHLMGHVYLDRMSNLSTLTHMREFYRYWVKEEE